MSDSDAYREGVDLTALGDTDAEPEITLPEQVRARVIGLASDVLGRLRTDEIPLPLRQAAKFTPAKRAKLARADLAAAVADRAAFRLRVAEAAEQALPQLAEAIRDGRPPGAADPVDVAVLAYLWRPPQWTDLIAVARVEIEQAAVAAVDRQAQEQVAKLRAELKHAQEDARERAEQSRQQLAQVRAEADQLRKQIRELTGRARAAEREATGLREQLATERQAARTAEIAGQAEVRRVRQELTELQDSLESARRTVRDARSADDVRLWLLLETLGGAVQGLRRELAVAPTEDRPADVIAGDLSAAAGQVEPPTEVVAARGDEPAMLDRLLELPRVHVVVDGYNVTKTGYGDLPLEAQRNRLLRGLAGLAARTGAEVTCVYDGAERPPVNPPSPRGVRVLFSPQGVTADELIRRLVAAEPPGRSVVVVSSDREVADGVRRPGVWPLASSTLLARLTRT